MPLVLPVDNVMFIGGVTLRLITGLSDLCLYVRQEAAEAGDWLLRHMNDVHDIITEEPAENRSYSGAGAAAARVVSYCYFYYVIALPVRLPF